MNTSAQRHPSNVQGIAEPTSAFGPVNLQRRSWVLSLGLRLGLLSLGAGSGLGAGAARAAAAGPRPLPIPLAMDAPPEIEPRGFLVSEKLDGVRAVWDGQTLRFRSGITIMAPQWFLRRLPDLALDGELWFGRGRFEALSGAVRRQQPLDEEWRALRYCAFELPSGHGDFAARHRQLESLVRRHAWPQLQAVQQRSLTSRAPMLKWLDEVVAGGGEGLMLRAADAAYRPGRSAQMLKLKPLQDAEAVVLAHEPGRGRFAGRLGALRVRTDEGVEFKIGTGFSDLQRERPPAVGQRITFNYRGLTEDGVPRFASFLRERAAGI
jgi:DNA ligase 1